MPIHDTLTARTSGDTPDTQELPSALAGLTMVKAPKVDRLTRQVSRIDAAFSRWAREKFEVDGGLEVLRSGDAVVVETGPIPADTYRDLRTALRDYLVTHGWTEYKSTDGKRSNRHFSFSGSHGTETRKGEPVPYPEQIRIRVAN